MYNLFISHSWAYSDAYERLMNLLRNHPTLIFRDYSVPKNDPIHSCPYNWQLRSAIENQIRPASCVLILAGVYSTYSKWINIEIEIARRLGKRIIAIQPWGAEHTSTVVKNNADIIVNWNTDSIVNAIKGYK